MVTDVFIVRAIKMVVKTVQMSYTDTAFFFKELLTHSLTLKNLLMFQNMLTTMLKMTICI